jgi:hemoglobin
MEDSHPELLITSDEWDAFMDDLNRSLDQFEVPQQERSEVIAIVESTRSAIVAEAAQERAARPPADVT